MKRTTQTLPAETGGTDITRFNALRHGVLSRYTAGDERGSFGQPRFLKALNQQLRV